MNCSECGHSVDKHAHWGDCLEKQCSCHNTPDKIRIAWFETELVTLQTRLTATEAALTAAGELIEAIRYGITGEVTIGGMENYERMKKAFEQYETACEALKP